MSIRHGAAGLWAQDGGELDFQQSTDNTAAYRLCVDDVSLTGGAAPPVYHPETGPRVRVNQVGYLPRGPKGATLVTVASGRTTPRGVDPSAGENVQSIDFSSYTKTGTGLTLVEPQHVVPGHGPVCGVDGVRSMREYLEYVRRESRDHWSAASLVSSARMRSARPSASGKPASCWIFTT